jgi:hypothetical protein
MPLELEVRLADHRNIILQTQGNFGRTKPNSLMFSRNRDLHRDKRGSRDCNFKRGQPASGVAADELFLKSGDEHYPRCKFRRSLHTSSCSFCDRRASSNSDWSKSRSFGDHLKALRLCRTWSLHFARQMSALRVQRTSHSSLTYHTKIQSEYAPVSAAHKLKCLKHS